jgi:pimeloyl-ACP methyl ester carboxylesterase/putative sterol carrier protein
MATGSVVQSVGSLPERFIPERARDIDTRFRLKIGSLIRDVIVSRGTCKVEKPSDAEATTISTAPATWLEIESGELSGIEAFATRRLSIRGSIQESLLFEPLFERPDAGGLRYRVEEVRHGHQRMSTVVAGSEDKPPLVMLHGLGGTKASLLPIVPGLTATFQVFVPDLPGFGASTKPRGRYDAPWFAEHVTNFMTELGIERAHFVGNSMGGRITQELALRHPEKVAAMALLCPATAFSYRPGLRIVRLLRPELGVALGYLPRRRVQIAMKTLFSKPSRIETSWFEAAADDFLRTWRSPRARMAFFAAVRNIYLDEPYGETGFFTRLATMQPPAFYVFGRRDTLISPNYAKKIAKVLPNARVELWEDCGHTPQLEFPARTADSLLEFFGRHTARAAAAG